MNMKTLITASYFNILYFFEIINLMFVLLVTFGTYFSIGIGIILTIALSLHIIRFYFNKRFSRLIQLCIMDLHLAYSIPFFINIIMLNLDLKPLDYGFIIIRIIICIIESIFIYRLTEYKIIKTAAD